MKKYAGLINLRILFISIQIILYGCFLILDFTGSNLSLSNRIKFTIIILCFCYALFTKGHNRSISYLMKAALFFTLISDLFILMLNHYFYGVLTFIAVQQLYNYKISFTSNQNKGVKSSGKTFMVWLVVQVLAAVIVCSVLFWIGIESDGLLIASIFYFICICTNTIRADVSAFRKTKDKGSALFAAGLSLFLLCDINVGLFNMSGFLYLPDKIYSVIYPLSSVLMWFFYAPSQVLLALCSNEKNSVQKS